MCVCALWLVLILKSSSSSGCPSRQFCSCLAVLNHQSASVCCWLKRCHLLHQRACVYLLISTWWKTRQRREEMAQFGLNGPELSVEMMQKVVEERSDLKSLLVWPAGIFQLWGISASSAGKQLGEALCMVLFFGIFLINTDSIVISHYLSSTLGLMPN